MKAQIILIVSTLLLLTSGCKKDKLTGGYSEAIGSWKLATIECNCCELIYLIFPNYNLDLKEKGKYKLSKDNKKIEHGRLLKVDDRYTFKHDDINKKNDVLDGLHIVSCKNDTLRIYRGSCGDGNNYVFIRE